MSQGLRWKVLKDNSTLAQLLDEASGIEHSESCAASIENEMSTSSTENTYAIQS